MKNFTLLQTILFVLFICVALLFVGKPVSADSIPSNIEYLDEMDLVYEIGGSDALYGSKHLDVGVMTGILNLGNPWNDEDTGSYAMVKADVKGIRLINRLWKLITGK